MSINVEDVGGALFLEHYVEEISERLHCRVVSLSDVLIGREFTTVRLIWELIATPINDSEADLHNNVWIYTTEKYDQYLSAHRLEYEDIRLVVRANTDAHNAEETPYFAESIQRKALRNATSTTVAAMSTNCPTTQDKPPLRRNTFESHVPPCKEGVSP
jgi:hypothetical protein